MTNRNRIALASVFALAAAASPADAFYQKTTLEGTLGSDIGGVWLAVHHVMPTFRVRLDRDPDTIAPFKVGPVSADLAPAMPASAGGVAIKEFTTAGAGERYGIFVGDVITRVNTAKVASEEDFQNALKDVKEWFLITVRRPALKFSTVRIVKLSYDASEQEVDGTSEIAEKVEVKVAEGALPFQDQIENARKENKFFTPTKEQVEALEEGWFKLEPPAQAVYLNGEHRVVAASNYDASLRQDDNLADSSFAIVSTLRGNPLGGGGGGQNIAIYGFEKVGSQQASGTYVESTLATAPFPISIEFNGRFEMTKLAPYSEKDAEFLTARAQAEAKEKQAEENRKIELAPDIPADLPKETGEPPAVAE